MRINWVAVLVAALVHWLFGAAWFTAMAAPWRAGLRMSPEEIQAYMSHPNFWPYVIAFACNLVLAYVIARVLALSETFNVFRGIRVGLLIGLVAAAAMITELAFEMRSLAFIEISAAYPLIGCIIMGVVLGAWKPKGVSLSNSAAAQ